MRYPYSPLTADRVRFQTSMAIRIGAEMLGDAKEYEADARKAEREVAGECRRCFYLHGGRFGGAAIASWLCGVCAVEHTHGSTNTPKVCEPCSDEHKLCRQCGGDREMRANRRAFPVPVAAPSTGGRDNG